MKYYRNWECFDWSCVNCLNRPLPSSKNPHFQNEAKCTTFLVKMSFIWNEKSFPYQRLSTYPRFDTETRWNSEMAYLISAWNRTFPVFISTIVWNMCENLRYESVYFKELHNDQESLLTDNIQSTGSCSVNYYLYSVSLAPRLFRPGQSWTLRLFPRLRAKTGKERTPRD